MSEKDAKKQLQEEIDHMIENSKKLKEKEKKSPAIDEFKFREQFRLLE